MFRHRPGSSSRLEHRHDSYPLLAARFRSREAGPTLSLGYLWASRVRREAAARCLLNIGLA